MIDEARILAECDIAERRRMGGLGANLEYSLSVHCRALLAERKRSLELLAAVLPTLDDLAKKHGLSFSEAEGMAVDIREHLKGGQS